MCNECVLSLDMNFNVSKSVTMIFEPYKTARRVLYTFPTLTSNGCSLDVVNSYRYLGHVISCVTDDNTDILRQMSLLYARTNVLLRKYSKCSQAVELCLFRAHCIQLYGASLWELALQQNRNEAF